MSSDTNYEDGAFALNPDDTLNDVIDITEIDMNDQERWLIQCTDTYSNADVNDIKIWLQQTLLNEKTNSECISDANKQLIDTRTWTRPKKRFTRLNFESIKEVTSLPSSHTVKNNIWQLGDSELLKNNVVNQQVEMNLNENNDERIPPMLKLSLAGSSNVGYSTTTGQESLEAFLNMSQSNGIDSFINMEAPELNETFFINVTTTRPSAMSISSSSSVYSRDDNNHSINQTIGMADSQILTDSMMHTSIFNDMSEVNFNDAFANDNVNVSVIENPNYMTEKSDKTIFCGNDTFNCSTKKINEERIGMKINTTFTSNELSETVNPEVNVNETFTADLCETNHLSYIVIKKKELTDDKCTDNLDIFDEEADTKVELNATFDAESSSSHESINSTLTLSPQHGDNSSKMSNNNIDQLETLNTTYSENENESPIEMISKINKTSPNSIELIKSTIKGPLLLNNRQLNSINSTFVAEVRMNETYDGNMPSIQSPTNRYQTYRKNPLEMKKKNLPSLDTTYDHNFVPPNPPLPPTINRYQTYRKNSTTSSQIKSTNISSDNCPQSGVIDNQAKSLENLAGMNKNIQIPRKLHAPKNFSRLPQSLQKSNPNLTSSSGLKLAAIPSRISNFGFNRQRQIKNGDPSLTNKLYSVAKLSKCGSEQVLDGSMGNSRYLETGGSTESIESTQSAHSAPDLDDRLSTCSDSSHNSYCQRTINIDELHKIVQRQEESLKRECMSERKILENTWVTDATSLPSPILKETETIGSCGSSPGSINATVKTSSPILSPSESLQLLNVNSGDHLTNDKTDIKPFENEQQKNSMMSNKPPRISELKSGIRQPLNRGTNGMRGIPRPASRIPAPRFTRASIKSYVETKKNVL